MLFDYYKCRTKGCRCNKSAAELHRAFAEELTKYTLRKDLKDAIQYELEHMFLHANEDNLKQEQAMLAQLTETNKKIENIAESHYVTGSMPKEVFEKFIKKLSEQRAAILESLQKCSVTISNLSQKIEECLDFCTKLSTVWASSRIAVKEDLQKFDVSRRHSL